MASDVYEIVMFSECKSLLRLKINQQVFMIKTFKPFDPQAGDMSYTRWF